MGGDYCYCGQRRSRETWAVLAFSRFPYPLFMLVFSPIHIQICYNPHPSPLHVIFVYRLLVLVYYTLNLLVYFVVRAIIISLSGLIGKIVLSVLVTLAKAMKQGTITSTV